MERNKMITMMKTLLEDRVSVRQNIESDRVFQKKVPFEVKDLFYKVYDKSLKLNFEVLKDMVNTKGEYEYGDLYDEFIDSDDLFLDFCLTVLSDFYGMEYGIFF